MRQYNMATSKPESKAQAIQAPALPAGYFVRSEDVVGFWNPESEHRIICIPMSATMFDSSIEPQKVSILVVAKLVEACKLDGKKEGERVDGKPGDLVGLWGKPGLRELRNLGEQECIIDYTGKEDIGKPSPMHTFRVASKERGMSLPVSSDRRSRSKGVATWLDV